MSQLEGNSGVTPFTFTVTRSGDTTVSTTVTYLVAGTGANPASPNDFSGATFPTGSLFFNAGDTSQVVTVPVQGDTSIEPDEQFSVTITNASNATITANPAVGTIQNDDFFVPSNLAIQATDANKIEGNAGTTVFSFTVTRTGDTTGTTTVNYSVAGSTAFTGFAANNIDFAGGVLPTGTIIFNPGDTSMTIPIPVNGDTTPESDEGFVVTLSAALLLAPPRSPSPRPSAISSTTTRSRRTRRRTCSSRPTSRRSPPGRSRSSSWDPTPTSPAQTLTYSASASNVDGTLRSQYNFFAESPTYYFNTRGQGEKYIKSTISLTDQPIQPGSPNGYYYFIMPNGNLYEYVDPYNSPSR